MTHLCDYITDFYRKILYKNISNDLNDVKQRRRVFGFKDQFLNFGTSLIGSENLPIKEETREFKNNRLDIKS